MKVLVISAFPPDPAPEANHALHLSEHLADAGLAVHVLCRNGSIAAAHPGVVVHPVIEDWTWSDLPRLVRCLRQTRPDVVLLLYLGWIYGHNTMITFLPTLCRLVLPGVPCVTQFEAIDEDAPRRSLLTRAIRKGMALGDVHPLFGTLLRDSARIIALSGPHRAKLVRHDPAVEEKSVILPPPPLIRVCADPPAVARKQARDAIGVAPDDFVLVYFGYVYPGKGVETLLHAFRIECRRNRHIRLLMVGGTLELTDSERCREYFRMVQQLPGRLGIADRVTCTGQFGWDSDEGSRYLHAGDACVLPFDYGVTLNNSSLAAASTHGLPVIATELAAGREEALEHGRNIYLCRPRDPEMLADAIHAVAGSAGLRERLRAGVVGLARDWHRWEATTERMVRVLESTVSRGAPSGRTHSASSAAASAAPAPINGHTPDDRPRRGEAPFVSVIVAAYNVDAYLSQCLDSLVHQTLPNIEIIVVNDASTDDTLGVIEEYRSRYPHVRVVTCATNRGLASVRNIGMEAATGRYIAFIDGDDWADIRMCEAMYRRASEHDADVLIADATVVYEDSKTVGQFFDQHVRRTLAPELRTMPFEVRDDPRVLLVEPVAWTKLYRRSFLEEHGLRFEDGMNSYEDMCFHFSVLLKAARISLIDEPLFFYRQNRPGQISGRTDRRVFEVFDVFDKIHANLAAARVPADIWALLVEVQVRQFDWLLGSRVRPHHRREFLALVARQLARTPEAGVRRFARQATRHELVKLRFMQGRRLRAYTQLARQRWRPFLHSRAAALLRPRLAPVARAVVHRLLGVVRHDPRLQAVYAGAHQLATLRAVAPPSDEPLVEVCKLGDVALLVSHPADKRGLPDAIWRTQQDYYLSQTAVFREGDTVVDVGAHVGVFSMYLAKRYPFIRVYAIEPDPVNYRCLTRNLELNGLTNVVAVHRAISGDGRDHVLYGDAHDSGWATIDPRTASSRTWLRVVPVASMTLDQLFHEHEIRHCRLLKITASGALGDILEGFTRSGGVDLLCGEADLRECSRVTLETASWRIARQHFWRTVAAPGGKIVGSFLQQLPRGCEPEPPGGRPPARREDPVAEVDARPFGTRERLAHALGNGRH